MPSILKNIAFSLLSALIGGINVASAAKGTQYDSFFGGYAYPPDLSASISADGRYLALASRNALTVDDTNKRQDIFIKDTASNIVTRVSSLEIGDESNNESISPRISANGLFVTFVSLASNLVNGDTNDSTDIFIYNRLLRTISRISKSSGGVQGKYNSIAPSISADGRYVAFQSYADNLVLGDNNFISDIFIHDNLLNLTNRVSINSLGQQAIESSLGSTAPSISADGRFIAFVSDATNLVAGDTNNVKDIFVHDRLLKTTKRVSVPAVGTQQSNGVSDNPSISANGRYIAFESDATNLVTGDTNALRDVFVRDTFLNTTTRVSISSGGIQGKGASTAPKVSANGQLVAFNSQADFFAGVNQFFTSIYIHNLFTKQTTLIPHQDPGISNAYSSSISADGRFVTLNNLHTGSILGSPFIRYSSFLYDRIINTANQTSLEIATIAKPVSIPKNSVGNFTFKITNNGPSATNPISLTHIVSKGSVVNFIPSQGFCSRFSIISLCNLGSLLPGASLNLQVVVKATSNALSQAISVSSPPTNVTSPVKSSILVTTTVTP